MNGPVLVLCLFGYALMAALPFAFFRRGRPNVRWLLTAAPFFASAGCVLGGMLGMLTAAALPGGVLDGMQYAAVGLVASAVTLIGCTMGVHREPISLWHQDDDAPASLVTRGPYARVRHPFYTSFLLLLAGTTCALPHPVTGVALILGCVQLDRTARREERRLLASRFGGSYAQVMMRTGRFLPRLSGPSADAVHAHEVGQLTPRADLELAVDVAEVGAHGAR